MLRLINLRLVRWSCAFVYAILIEIIIIYGKLFSFLADRILRNLRGVGRGAITCPVTVLLHSMPMLSAASFADLNAGCLDT